MEKKMNNKGFSLVELIIVIAIMAVLVGVLAPQFMKYVERSRKSTDVQNVAAIVEALQVYAVDPMVTDALASGEIQLTTTSADVDTTNCTGHSDEALKAAGITKIGLKSSKWGTNIKLTFTVNADGSVTFAESGLVDSDHSLLQGKYK